MCGIAGIIDFNNNSSVEERVLSEMEKQILHRGPDAGQIHLNDTRTCGLAHRRLSIIDLSESGTQPIFSDDRRYSIIFNGEIYNHLELREQLKNKGYNFQSNADTEVILYGYIEFGKKILQMMTGMWSFVIWDEQRQELFGSRDRVGIKPFYYYRFPGGIVFASEIKSILKHPLVKKELNLSELPNYLNYAMSGNKESLFKGIKKLTSGNFLKFNKNNFHIEEYWNVLNSPVNNDISFDEAGKEIVNQLRQSVKSRMMSDVPFGVFLSGGIDSSLNVALMDELMDRPVDTYTVGYKELEEFNELKYARKVSEIYKTNHHEILIDDKQSSDVLEDIAWHTDEPNGDPVCIPLYYVSKLTKESGTTVIQVGEGSDEQFVGYEWMLQGYNFFNSYWKFYKSLPQFFRKLIYRSSSPLFTSQNQYLAQEYLRRATYDEEFYWNSVPVFGVNIQEKLFKDKSLSKIPYQYISELYSDLRKYEAKDYFRDVIFLELKQRLAELLLMRVDKIGMAHSLEARVPFLDHRLVEFTTSLPDSIKVPDKKQTKLLLKRAIEDILPKEIIYRKKMGFAAPVHSWFRKEWKSLAEHHLFHSEFSKLEILNKDVIKKLFDSHQSGKKKGQEIYSLVALSIWYDRYFI